MASLLETNPYLRDPEIRRLMLERNAYESSIASGARGLTAPASSAVPRKRRVMAVPRRSVTPRSD